MKTEGSKKKKSDRKDGTGWGKLGLMSAVTIRKGIAADPDAHATDEEVWRTAKAVMPVRKGL